MNCQFWVNFFRHIFSGKQYQDILKGIICTQTNISNIIKDEKAKTEISNKPFLMQIAIVTIFLGFTYFYFFSALKHRLSLNHSAQFEFWECFLEYFNHPCLGDSILLENCKSIWLPWGSNLFSATWFCSEQFWTKHWMFYFKSITRILENWTSSMLGGYHSTWKI